MKNFIQSVLVLITVLSSTTGAEDVIYAMVGQTVTLKSPEVKSQNTYLSWLFGNKDYLELAWRNPLGGSGIANEQAEHWKNHLSWSGNSLNIHNIQQQHFGTFTCKMSNVIFTYKILQFNVNVSPSTPLLPGESLSLDCNTETREKPEIYWLNPQGEKIGNNQGKIRVGATSQHNGQWTCVVTNNSKQNTATISVMVIDLSPAPLRPQYTSLSSPLTIPCSIPAPITRKEIQARGTQRVRWQFFHKTGSSLISNDPQMLFSLSLEDPLTWKAGHNRGLITHVLKTDQPLNLSLTRKQGRQDDSGDYVCTLEFKNGVTLNRTVRVDVLELISSAGTDLISGQQVNLTCSIGHPLPSDLQVKWFSPEQLLADHHSDYLIIPEVGTADGGKWRCELWQNSTWLTSAVITLKIEPKLSVWMLVIICSAAFIVILLLILVFILFQRRKRKMRHFRHRLCQCKNPKPKGFYRT